jgi:3-oxoacyl-[acyl-carrier-protein] synthase-1
LPLSIALAAEGWKRGYAPSGIALALAGSDAGERGAVLMMSNI